MTIPALLLRWDWCVLDQPGELLQWHHRLPTAQVSRAQFDSFGLQQCRLGGNDLGEMTSKTCLFYRSQQNESACASGRAACMELQTQSAVVEFIINHTDVLFRSESGSAIADGAGECLPALALS